MPPSTRTHTALTLAHTDPAKLKHSLNEAPVLARTVTARGGGEREIQANLGLQKHERERRAALLAKVEG